MVKPEIVFKVGAVRASVFRNTIEKNGQLIPLPKVAIEVRYKDKTGKWQGTNSLSLNDLPIRQRNDDQPNSCFWNFFG